MKISEVITKFNDQAYAKKWKPSELGKKRVERIVSSVGSDKRVLDIGCYDGTISKEIQKNKNQVVGVDIAASAVKLAKKRGIETYTINIEEESIPVKLGKFDIIVAGEIIEHIFDPDSFLKKLNRALKPGGHIVLTTPNIAGLGSRLYLLMGKLPWMIENDILPGKSGHIRYYTFDALKMVLERQGFKVVNFTTDSIGVGNYSFPLMNNFVPRLGRILIVKAQKV